MSKKNVFNSRSLTLSAMIAAVYAVLTLALPVLSYGASTGWEMRISEALTVLPIILPEAVPGLVIGCLVANLLSPVGVLDVVFGTLATLIAALGTRALRRSPWLAAACPVISNALIVGTLLSYVYGLPLFFTMLQVGIGELAAVLIGMILYHILRNRSLPPALEKLFSGSKES